MSDKDSTPVYSKMYRTCDCPECGDVREFRAKNGLAASLKKEAERMKRFRDFLQQERTLPTTRFVHEVTLESDLAELALGLVELVERSQCEYDGRDQVPGEGGER